ncbi:erythromycin esterase family protein [Actinoplanes sp. NEAU-A12]|uniref:Erythromycin esterase family protein n=1 Tax=Actinoplanes sandaracinus TaxID=3045177 RepID=A0ABT6WR83_9ACTN|nr:erythromycin esterase family protein [Actinoplanes sandaracinus]MDI6102251.1 erythromycin esterase family protein [Actinoplanes sandaracinus]
MIRYSDEVASIARPLRDPGDLEILLDRAAQARVVMIGEATHGTHEFYQWRAALTRRLILERGFSFVAVEGDWPDCERVNAAVRGDGAGPREALVGYDRWPTWMWANEETVDFACWLHALNESRAPDDRVGFHGLDVYSLWESMREILTWLREHDPEAVPAALDAYRCFEPYNEDPNAYGWATRFLPAACENKVVAMLAEVRDRDFGVWQNAEVVAGAERYYRTMVHGGPGAWNIRDRHMDETLDRLLRRYGPEAKAVVWAHNTHVGDGRATDQAEQGEVTIGQLARDRYGADRVVLVGFGTHHGTVVAGAGWGAPMEVMGVPAARRGSLEEVLQNHAPPAALFVFGDQGPRPDLLTTVLPHRAIGVVYRPERERWANYVPTVLGERYDAFLWFAETRALLPLHTLRVDVHEPETYPSGV